MYYISKYLKISEGKVWLNGQLQFQSAQEDWSEMIKELFKNCSVSYPKFYKMDDLCKLAFVGSEWMLANESDKEIALLFSNSEASLETDLRHQETIQTEENFFPSPAVFVYTLPNITIGEVSIRHQLQTESCFFVSDEFPVETMESYANYLLKTQKANKVLCAWIHKLQNSYEAQFYMVEKEGILEHKSKNITKIVKE